MAAAPAAIRSNARGARRPRLCALALLLAALGLTVVFWFPLWAGGGLVGSDIYAYFLPQKAYYSELLRVGSFPVWNNRIGWGYPQLAESQTGVFYPLNLALYGWLALNAAFNASQIAHYVLAFVFMWMLARQIGLAPLGAGLAALVYTYGWFPTRVCLEWAIVGGAWLPLVLWCVERSLHSGEWRYAIGLTLALGLQMLAGHFTLAFITQLTVAAYVPLRLWIAPAETSARSPAGRSRRAAVLALAVAGAFFLAAAQLLPTWELKQQSQRQGVTAEHDPRYGYIPPRSLWQAVAPWHWYTADEPFDEAIVGGPARTNRVEAHLYFGLLPLALAAFAVVAMRRKMDVRLVVWLGMGLTAAVYATGILIPITKHLPGFSFFEGPGRFGVVTTLAVGLWAGRGLDESIRRLRGTGRFSAAALVFAISAGDLWLVSRQSVADPWLMGAQPWLVGPQSKFVYLVDRPPMERLGASPLRQVLSNERQPVRLYSEGKNLPSLLGVATLPTYLGLGPAAYFDVERQLPAPFDFRRPPTQEQLAWFGRSGVTHLLSFVPLDARHWPVQPAWVGNDPFLNQALARSSQELLYLYRFMSGRRRVAWEQGNGPEPRLAEYLPTRIVIETAASNAGRLIVTDLDYPGWQVTIDGAPAKSLLTDGIFRSVDVSAGNHVIVWTYHPASLYWGAGISLATLIVLSVLGHVRYWHADWFASALRTTESSSSGTTGIAGTRG